MRDHLSKFITISFATILLITTASAESQEISPANEALLKQISKGFSQVAKKATPAVVYIESQGVERPQPQTVTRPRTPSENPFDYFNDELLNRFFGFPFNNKPEQPSQKSETVRGTGFVVTADGYIVTNFHVVEKATKVNVTLQNGKKLVATVIGTDPKTDLAVIKIDEKNLSYLIFADSDAIEVGDWAIAVGNPFGLQASVTVGVISAKGRNQLHIADFEDFIQTDAAINPGNSGGPLLNAESEVVGVNTAIVSGSGGYMGIGFAIPSNMAKQIVSQLIKNGQVIRGFLGVTLQPIDSDLSGFYKLSNVQGALITDVVKGSPADLAGLKQEDIIVAYNGMNVENLSTFRNYVSLLTPGAKLSLKINREGKIQDFDVLVTSLPDEIAGPHSPVQRLGLKVQNLTPDISQQLGFIDEKGVVITHIEASSPAAEAALRPGNLIIAVNRKKVANVEEFNIALTEAAKDGRVLLMVRQGSAVRFVALHFN